MFALQRCRHRMTMLLTTAAHNNMRLPLRSLLPSLPLLPAAMFMFMSMCLRPPSQLLLPQKRLRHPHLRPVLREASIIGRGRLWHCPCQPLPRLLTPPADSAVCCLLLLPLLLLLLCGVVTSSTPLLLCFLLSCLHCSQGSELPVDCITLELLVRGAANADEVDLQRGSSSGGNGGI